MSSIKSIHKMLVKYARARIPFVAIETIEKNRILAVLRSVAEELNLRYFVFTLSKGIYNIATGKVIKEDKTMYGAIDFMTDEMKKTSNLTLVMTETPDISSESADAKQILDLVNLANETGGQIIVLTNKAVWNTLQRQGLSAQLDMPNEEEMYDIMHSYIDEYRGMVRIEWDESDIREAASIMAGVTRIEAENVLAALVANGRIRKSDMDEVRSAKDRLFSNISGLERIDVSPENAEVGGLAGLQKWLNEKKQLMSHEKRELLKSKGLQPPRGILLVGVPGCGKSLSAKSIAANWKLPLYRLDFATVQGSYVGQSEHQLKEALTTAENVSPCILWIDEIEKGLSGATGGNDGGVSTRMVGQFLFWLQECKKQVFVVATANDVSQLPSELLRRGRFDELFFIDLPNATERNDILTLYMKKYLNVEFSGDAAENIIRLTDGFTGADLESTIRDLAYRTIANDEFVLTEENIISAFNNVVPLSQTSPEKIEDIRNWGKARAVPASGRPIGAEEIAQKKDNLTRKVLV